VKTQKSVLEKDNLGGFVKFSDDLDESDYEDSNIDNCKVNERQDEEIDDFSENLQSISSEDNMPTVHDADYYFNALCNNMST